MDFRSSGIQRWRRYSLDTRTRAAFAGLAHTAAVLVFVDVVTALKFSAYDFPVAASARAGWWAFGRESAALAAALIVAVPLLVAAGNLAPVSGLRRYAWLVVTTPLCVLACVESPLPQLLTGLTLVPFQRQQMGALVVLLVLVFEFRQRALATAAALLRTEIDDVTADARLRDESLRRLHAQIAPHFLFNTLANVTRLAHLDRREAAAMLGDLVRYFSVTLARGDNPHTSLGDEVRLVDAYLRIHRVRMGGRLAYAIDVPDELTGARVPTMMLLTLVENAIKHGINPLVEGGFVHVRAERRGRALHLEVADNGRGLTVTEGHGMGLANLRARLSMLYGAGARLVLEHGHPRGFVASVVMPFGLEPRP
jgi:sensor histidine kinase YesM